MRRVKDFGVPESSPNGRRYHVQTRFNKPPTVVPDVEMITPDDVELPPGNNYRPCLNHYTTIRVGEAVMTRVVPFERAYKSKDFEWESMTKRGSASVHSTLIPAANHEIDYCRKLPDLEIKLINEIEVNITTFKPYKDKNNYSETTRLHATPTKRHELQS